jgi:2,3-bisphosphoglycerate-dependent phosphoglycerate mutase
VPTRVLLLRHGESADPSVFHGAESDVDLSEKGRRQAEAIAAQMVAFSPVVVVSSAMRRALRTAEPISRSCGVSLRIEPQLHERGVGMLEGTPNNLAEGPWPETVLRWTAGDTAYATPGAESFDDVRNRVLPIWERVATELDNSTYVIVAHGVVIRVLLLNLLPGWSAADYRKLGPIPNVAVSELVRTMAGQPWQAERLNEIVVE